MATTPSCHGNDTCIILCHPLIAITLYNVSYQGNEVMATIFTRHCRNGQTHLVVRLWVGEVSRDGPMTSGLKTAENSSER